MNVQPYPKVKLRNAAQDFYDGWALTTLLLNPVHFRMKRGVGAALDTWWALDTYSTVCSLIVVLTINMNTVSNYKLILFAILQISLNNHGSTAAYDVGTPKEEVEVKPEAQDEHVVHTDV